MQLLLLTAGVWTCPLEDHCRKDPPPRTRAPDSPEGINEGSEESENKPGNQGTLSFGRGSLQTCIKIT